MTIFNFHRKSGRPFHNFISWQDLRAAELVKSWNQSCTMKVRLDLSTLIIFWSSHVVNNMLRCTAQIITLVFISVGFSELCNCQLIAWSPKMVTLSLCLCWQSIHGVMKVLHFLTRQKRFLAASLVVFSTQHVSLRLAWMLSNCPEVREIAGLTYCGEKGDVMDGER